MTVRISLADWPDVDPDVWPTVYAIFRMAFVELPDVRITTRQTYHGIVLELRLPSSREPTPIARVTVAYELILNSWHGPGGPSEVRRFAAECARNYARALTTKEKSHA